MGNTGEIKIRFGSGSVESFSSVETEERLESTDGAFNGNPLVVEGDPLVTIAEDTGIEAFVSIRIDVNAPPVSRGSTGLLA